MLTCLARCLAWGCAVACQVTLVLSCLASNVDSAQRPNIILIVADDLGWDDVSFHGSDQIPTPNIDSLANNGVILNNYYVQPICTPTRAALMTGRHPIHLGLQHSVLGAARPDGLGLNETLLPQYLNKLGYTSHMVGKWHLGFYAKEFTPTFRGFESHFGYWQGAEDYLDHTSWQGTGYWGLDFHRGLDPVFDEFGQYSTEVFTSEAERIIKQHKKSQPLFLYLAHQAVHVGNTNVQPLQAPRKYIDRFPHIKNEKRRTFAGMVAALDDSVGNITKALRSNGMLKNSIIVFTTDNGGPADGLGGNCACNWPLRGTKFQLWEGGVRGTGFIHGPQLTAGAVSGHMMHVCDWLPTLVHAAGGDASSLKNLDGFDMWESLTKNKSSPRTEILHNIDPTNKVMNEAAIRVGEYKLIMGKELPYGRDFSGWYSPNETCGERENAAGDHLGGEHVTVNGVQRRINLKNVSSSFLLTQKSRTSYLKSIRIQCGPIPTNASSNCEPMKSPCLYHIPSDPCEFRNLANEKPGIVMAMMSRLQVWNSTAVPIKSSPNDPRGNPKNFNGIWTPWVNLTTEFFNGL